MAKIVGYMVTWRTYGTWAERKEKEVSREGELPERDERLQEWLRRNQKHSTVRLNRNQRKVVEDAIVQGAGKTGEKVLAVAVHSNHVHVVLRYNGKPIERTVRRLKNAAYFALRERGFSVRVWARGYDKRYCFDEAGLRARIRYVKGHGE